MSERAEKAIHDIALSHEALMAERDQLKKEVEEQARLLGISGSKEVALLSRVERLEKALKQINNVGLDKELGQIVSSEHYEKAWLDCVEIAKEALQSDGCA